MELVNNLVSDDEFYTGATYVDWPDPFGLSTAGKTGTSEYCDNIAIDRGWCRFEDIEQRRILRGELNYFDHPAFGLLLQITLAPEPEAEEEIEADGPSA